MVWQSVGKDPPIQGAPLSKERAWPGPLWEDCQIALPDALSTRGIMATVSGLMCKGSWRGGRRTRSSQLWGQRKEGVQSHHSFQKILKRTCGSERPPSLDVACIFTLGNCTPSSYAHITPVEDTVLDCSTQTGPGSPEKATSSRPVSRLIHQQGVGPPRTWRGCGTLARAGLPAAPTLHGALCPQ